MVNYKDGRRYDLAVAFMLAHPYGYPLVMSSYAFETDQDGPPDVSPLEAGGCDAAWVCEHRRAVQVRVRRPDVLRFLFQERRFPRAFYHTVCEAETCLHALPHNEKPRRAVTRVKNKVMRVKPDSLSQIELHEFIDQLQLGLARVHDAIAASYFRARRQP